MKAFLSSKLMVPLFVLWLHYFASQIAIILDYFNTWKSCSMVSDFTTASVTISNGLITLCHVLCTSMWLSFNIAFSNPLLMKQQKRGFLSDHYLFQILHCERCSKWLVDFYQIDALGKRQVYLRMLRYTGRVRLITVVKYNNFIFLLNMYPLVSATHGHFTEKIYKLNIVFVFFHRSYLCWIYSLIW